MKVRAMVGMTAILFTIATGLAAWDEGHPPQEIAVILAVAVPVTILVGIAMAMLCIIWDRSAT